MRGALHFRPLDPAAWQDYLALRLRSIADWPAAIYPTDAEERGQSPERIQATLTESAHGVVFGAYDGATLIGIAGLRRAPLVQVAHKGVLWGVFVHPDHRQGGVARRLLEALFAHARAAGVRHVLLSVNAENERALGLYRSLGFEGYGREPAALQVAGRFYDEELMILRL